MPDDERSEDEQERLNRQMTELLNELRVAMPGVQVLFAFLLAVPFQQRFETVDSFQRGLYLVTLVAAATATAFFIAPSAYHRIAFQQHEKERSIAAGVDAFVAKPFEPEELVELVSQLAASGRPTAPP